MPKFPPPFPPSLPNNKISHSFWVKGICCRCGMSAGCDSVGSARVLKKFLQTFFPLSRPFFRVNACWKQKPELKHKIPGGHCFFRQMAICCQSLINAQNISRVFVSSSCVMQKKEYVHDIVSCLMVKNAYYVLPHNNHASHKMMEEQGRSGNC